MLVVRLKMEERHTNPGGRAFQTAQTLGLQLPVIFRQVSLLRSGRNNLPATRKITPWEALR